MQLLSGLISWIIATQILLLIVFLFAGSTITAVYAVYEYHALYFWFLVTATALIARISWIGLQKLRLRRVGAKSERTAILKGSK